MGKEKALHFAKILQKYKYMAVVIAVGFFLLILPQREGGKSEDRSTYENFDVKSFERKVEKALSECNGVGRCRVILSMDTGVERVYEKESRETLEENKSGGGQRSESDRKPSTLSEGSGRESAILLKEIHPKFRGAVVICDGADRTEVIASVNSCVSSLTGLRSDKISIIKMKK